MAARGESGATFSSSAAAPAFSAAAPAFSPFSAGGGGSAGEAAAVSAEQSTAVSTTDSRSNKRRIVTPALLQRSCQRSKAHGRNSRVERCYSTSDDSTALHQLQDRHYQRDEQEEVQQATQGVRGCETKHPQDQQNSNEGPEHDVSPCWWT
jgi:hypothetical protein